MLRIAEKCFILFIKNIRTHLKNNSIHNIGQLVEYIAKLISYDST